jgi:hypothetical protein
MSEEGFIREEEHRYNDLSTVESQRNDLTAEEFPEGSYGATLITSGTIGKSSPWRESQRSPKPYGYENYELHKGLSREYPGDHDMLGEDDGYE